MIDNFLENAPTRNPHGNQKCSASSNLSVDQTSRAPLRNHTSRDDGYVLLGGLRRWLADGVGYYRLQPRTRPSQSAGILGGNRPPRSRPPCPNQHETPIPPTRQVLASCLYRSRGNRRTLSRHERAEVHTLRPPKFGGLLSLGEVFVFELESETLLSDDNKPAEKCRIEHRPSLIKQNFKLDNLKILPYTIGVRKEGGIK